MVELVERYVHQVGRYLPKKERADIEQELRSSIQDQLDDRFDGSPSQADVATVLAELGSPHLMAASYNREQYLVGPDLYPFMIMALRYVWVIIPIIVIFLNVFDALVSSQQITQQTMWWAVLGKTLSAILQATFITSAVVVTIFAIVQRIVAQLDQKAMTFNPLSLPKVDDPRSVDRAEATFAIIIIPLMTLVFLYFLNVGGLTLRFNLSDPGEVIPVPTAWLALLILAILGTFVVYLWAIRLNRWTIPLWLAESVLEVFGAICMYYVLYKPLFDRFMGDNSGSLPEIIVIVTTVLTLIGKGSKLVGLWTYRDSSNAPAVASGPSS